MHNTCCWKITREGGWGGRCWLERVSQRTEGGMRSLQPPLPRHLCLTASAPVLRPSLALSDYAVAFHSFLPRTVSTRPWEIAGLRQCAHVCKSYSFTGLNVITEAVFWLQRKPLIATKLCGSIHAGHEAALSETLYFQTPSAALWQHLSDDYLPCEVICCGVRVLLFTRKNLPHCLQRLHAGQHLGCKTKSLPDLKRLLWLWSFRPCLTVRNTRWSYTLCSKWFLSYKLVMIGFASLETYKCACIFSPAMCCLTIWVDLMLNVTPSVVVVYGGRS